MPRGAIVTLLGLFFMNLLTSGHALARPPAPGSTSVCAAGDNTSCNDTNKEVFCCHMDCCRSDGSRYESCKKIDGADYGDACGNPTRIQLPEAMVPWVAPTYHAPTTAKTPSITARTAAKVSKERPATSTASNSIQDFSIKVYQVGNSYHVCLALDGSKPACSAITVISPPEELAKEFAEESFDQIPPDVFRVLVQGTTTGTANPTTGE